MNAADLARLELAKRAYRATEPNAAEVQRGVRKARLALRRPRVRRTWLSKTLVAVVLAMGGLAYAKPHALGELVSSALHAGVTAPKRLVGGGAAAPAALRPEALATAERAVRPTAAALPAQSHAEPAAAPELPNKPPQPALVESKRKAAGLVAKANDAGANAAGVAPQAPVRVAAASGAFPAPSPGEDAKVSDWGRVGAALAGGDEPRALAVLNELSESEDARTRDKADLGRAQLMMSNGDRDKACATARSLTNRRAGSRIERQAQVLLKGCSR